MNTLRDDEADLGSDPPGTISLSFSRPLLQHIRMAMHGGMQLSSAMKLSNPCHVPFNPHYNWTDQLPKTVGDLCEFTSPVYGIRAFGVMARFMLDLYKVKSLEQMAHALCSHEPILIGNAVQFLGDFCGAPPKMVYDWEKGMALFTTAYIAFRNPQPANLPKPNLYYDMPYVKRGLDMARVI